MSDVIPGNDAETGGKEELSDVKAVNDVIALNRVMAGNDVIAVNDAVIGSDAVTKNHLKDVSVSSITIAEASSAAPPDSASIMGLIGAADRCTLVGAGAGEIALESAAKWTEPLHSAGKRRTVFGGNERCPNVVIDIGSLEEEDHEEGEEEDEQEEKEKKEEEEEEEKEEEEEEERRE